jgi:hypothetical protein
MKNEVEVLVLLLGRKSGEAERGCVLISKDALKQCNQKLQVQIEVPKNITLWKSDEVLSNSWGMEIINALNIETIRTLNFLEKGLVIENFKCQMFDTCKTFDSILNLASELKKNTMEAVKKAGNYRRFPMMLI